MADYTRQFRIIEVEEGRLGKKVTAAAGMREKFPVATFTGKRIDFEQSRSLGNKESFAFQVGDNEYVYLDQPYCYFNHSCDPNCGVLPSLELITIKPVREGEELTYDYSTSMLERSWTMDCRCGSGICRGTVKDFDTLPEERQQYYLDRGIVQHYIVEHLSDGRKEPGDH